MLPPIELSPDERSALQAVFSNFKWPGYAILVDGEVKPCEMGEAFMWICEHSEECHVAKDYIGDYEVSTVFSINSLTNFRGDTALHFETMIFHPEMSSSTFDRYATLKDAQEGHRKACEHVGWNLG